MVATIHLLAGALIGVLVPDESVAIALSFFSHYVLDLLPHIDPLTFTDHRLPHTTKQIIAVTTDTLAVIMLGALLYFTHQRWQPILLCGLAAQLPDFLIPLEKYNWFYPFRRFHEMFHWQPKRAQNWGWYIAGLLTPAIIGVVSLVLIFF